MYEDSVDGHVSTDLFKPEFKKYLAARSEDEIQDTFDPYQPLRNNIFTEISHQPKFKFSNNILYHHGLKPISEWQIYTPPTMNGFYVIRSPFILSSTLYWLEQSLKVYCSPPYFTNFTDSSKNSTSNSMSNRCAFFSKSPNFPSWSHLGYRFYYETHTYDQNVCHQPPKDLCSLMEILSSAVCPDEFHAETALVNYYRSSHLSAGKSKCGTVFAHTDTYEVDQTAPLVSLSFGNSALFLCGGIDKTIKPVPVILRHGDVVLMTGQSRKFYHAVPRVFTELNLPQNLVPLFTISQEILEEYKVWNLQRSGLKKDSDVDHLSSETLNDLREFLNSFRVNIIYLVLHQVPTPYKLFWSPHHPPRIFMFNPGTEIH